MSGLTKITVYEDRSVKMPQLAQAQLDDLIKIQSLWDEFSLVIQADKTILARRYVGFAAYGETRLEVLPKIFYESTIDEEIQRKESIDLFIRLLLYTNHPYIKDIPPQYLHPTNYDLFEMFISILVKRFLDVFRREIHREYVTITEECQFVKGQIRFGETILKNIGLSHSHIVEYQDYTLNNVLNRILKTVFYDLYQQTSSELNKKDLRSALFLLADVEPVHLSNEIFDRVKFNRLNVSYQPILDLARILYSKKTPGFYEGKEKNYSFLIQLNKVFEMFVFRLLENGFKNIYSVTHESPTMNLLMDGSGNVSYRLEPDIIVSDEKRHVMILDAKYKNPVTSKGDIHPNESDVYQVLTYAHRYHVDTVALVYPTFRSTKSVCKIQKAFTILSLSKRKINLYIIGINILEKDTDLCSLSMCNLVQEILQSTKDMSGLINEIDERVMT
jgi:5-methylcytosine-specific restriction enzyme subunit McrC